MAGFDYKKFYEEQVEFYKRQIEFDTQQIGWHTREIERARKEDKELLEHVWSKGPLTRLEMDIWGDIKNYKGSDLKRELASRKRYYLSRKKNTAKLAKYEAQLAEMV